MFLQAKPVQANPYWSMSVLMKTQTGKDFSFNERLVSIVSVIRVDVSEYTAKHRPIPENLR